MATATGKKSAAKSGAQSAKRRKPPKIDVPSRNELTEEERRNVAALRAMYDGFGNTALPDEQRLKAILDAQSRSTMLHEHAAPSVIPWGGVHRGRKGWQRFLVEVATALQHGAYVCEHIQPSGEYVFAWGHFTTRTRDSGRTTRRDWQHRLRMRRGKVVELHEFYDSLQAAIDLGWVKAGRH